MRVTDATALAHRTIVAASVLGLRKPTRGLRVTVAELSAAPPGASADVIVLTDGARLPEPELPAALARAREAIGEADDGVVALVVGSPITRALVHTAREGVAASMEGRTDAYARAIVWAAARAEHAMLAPALDAERLHAIVDSAATADLTLVEPELAATSPALARIRGMRSPRARALLATLALGAGARPLLFVPSRVAPKRGLARAKLERLADGWVKAEPTSLEPVAATDIASAAMSVLRPRHEPMSFKDLLREARERWAAHARSTGARATPSSADVHDLAAKLHALAAAEDVTVFALDPSDPGWELTLL